MNIPRARSEARGTHVDAVTRDGRTWFELELITDDADRLVFVLNRLAAKKLAMDILDRL